MLPSKFIHQIHSPSNKNKLLKHAELMQAIPEE
jgi:hypothetical protein